MNSQRCGIVNGDAGPEGRSNEAATDPKPATCVSVLGNMCFGYIISKSLDFCIFLLFSDLETNLQL